ncbi:MAG: (d)CMP kinase [Alphaproteobacteria bacterium]
MIIAIDGLAASGKGTIAKMLAAHFGFAHLDTGLLYRAVGVAVLRAGGDPGDSGAAEAAARSLDPAAMLAAGEDPAMRSAEAGEAASKVAAIPAVRAALLDFQRNFCAKPPGGKGAVLDGRDIGTVIAPAAEVKIYVTCAPEIRAARRARELRGRGDQVTDGEVLAAMQERDARDQARGVAPAVPAADAVWLDTGSLDIGAAFAAALAIANKKNV